MKKLFLFLLVSVFIFSCDQTNVPVSTTDVVLGESAVLKEFSYDGCEYIYGGYGVYRFGLTHKGNCSNEAHRNQD